MRCARAYRLRCTCLGQLWRGRTRQGRAGRAIETMEHHTEYDDDSDRMYGHASAAPRTIGKRRTGLQIVIEMFDLLHVVISKVALVVRI